MATINCGNTTAPMNISKNNVKGPCSLLCDYNHKYGIYSPNVTNKGRYISLNYTNTGPNYPVTYNDLQYTVSEIRIYQPSLHTYNGKNTPGEILIIQGGNGKNLITSIPIIEGGKSDKGTVQLSELILEASQRISNKDESMTFSGGKFNLDNFIPNRVPFFAYSGSLPFKPCNGTYSYVVFDINNALNLSNSAIAKLQKIIEATTVKSIIGENYLFINKNGANAKLNDKDKIFIDCQPVNESGELLINETTGESSSSGTEELDMEKLKPFFYVIIAIGVAIVISKGVTLLFKKMKKT
jgi:carbonic anhydrase